MSIDDKLQELCSPLKPPEMTALSFGRPGGEDLILAGHRGNSGVHIRSDDAVELYSGSTRVLLSSEYSSCGILGNAVYLIGGNIYLTASQELSLNGYSLDNWYFLSEDSVPDLSLEPNKFVLVPRSGVSLDTPITPGSTLSTYVEARPLLKRVSKVSEVSFINFLQKGLFSSVP